jgi:hypothetical protein
MRGTAGTSLVTRALAFASVAALVAGCAAHGSGAVPTSTRAQFVTGARPSPVEIVVGTPTQPTMPSGFSFVPDEHVSMIKVGRAFRFFVSGTINGVHGSTGVLDTTDFSAFTASRGYQEPVFFPTPPTCSNSVFDEYYRAPGSVLTDPVRPGRLLMIYHGENHYYGPAVGCQPHVPYETLGFTHSDDTGHTWATGVPIVGGPVPQPTGLPIGKLGAGVPSAVIDKTNRYLYIVFEQRNRPGLPYIAAARTPVSQLGSPHPAFSKWHNRGFTAPGLGRAAFADSVFGNNSGVCDTTQDEKDPGLSYNDALGAHLLTLECTDILTGKLAWAFSTTTDLATENWTPPRVVEGSEDGLGPAYDWYSSFITPGAPLGHTGATGHVIYARGARLGKKLLHIRPFTICSNCP